MSVFPEFGSFLSFMILCFIFYDSEGLLTTGEPELRFNVIYWVGGAVLDDDDDGSVVMLLLSSFTKNTKIKRF